VTAVDALGASVEVVATMESGVTLTDSTRFPLGLSVVTYTARDISGRVSSCLVTIEVEQAWAIAGVATFDMDMPDGEEAEMAFKAEFRGSVVVGMQSIQIIQDDVLIDSIQAGSLVVKFRILLPANTQSAALTAFEELSDAGSLQVAGATAVLEPPRVATAASLQESIDFEESISADDGGTSTPEGGPISRPAAGVAPATLATNAELPNNAVERATFKTKFEADMSQLLAPHRATVTDISAGSVVVSFDVHSAAGSKIDTGALQSTLAAAGNLPSVGSSIIGTTFEEPQCRPCGEDCDRCVAAAVAHEAAAGKSTSFKELRGHLMCICFGFKPPPELETPVRLSDSLGGVDVKFSRSVCPDSCQHHGAQTEACGRYLEVVSTTGETLLGSEGSLLGESPTCFWASDTHFQILFGYKAALGSSSGAHLAFKKRHIVYTIGAGELQNGPFEVIEALNPPPLKAEVSYPSTISTCTSSVTIDGRASSGGGTAGLQYSWSQAGTISNDELAAVLVEATQGTACGRGCPTLTVPTRIMVEGATTELVMTVGRGGDDTAEVKIEINVETAPLPIVQIFAAHPPSRERVQPMYGAVMEGYAELASGCFGDEVEMEFKWSLVRDSVGSCFSDIYTDFRRQRSFLLPPDMESGNYIVTLTGRGIGDAESSNSDTVWIEIPSAPVQVEIIGGDRLIGSTERLWVQAEVYDPSCHGGCACKEVEYIWSTTSKIDSQEHVILDSGVASVEPGGLSLYILIAEGQLPVGTTTLRLTVDGASQDVNIQVESNELPEIAIVSGRMRVNADSRIVLVAKQGNPSTDVLTLQWSSVPGGSSSSLEGDIGDEASRLTQVSLTATDQPTLVIKPGALRPGGSYRFRITAGWADERNVLQSWSEVVVSASLGPSSGRLLVDPMVGEALNTNFALTADGWLAGSTEDLPLKYAFSSAASAESAMEDDAPLSSAAATSELNPALLPQGTAKAGYNIAVVCNIYNALGASTRTVLAGVNVKPVGSSGGSFDTTAQLVEDRVIASMRVSDTDSAFMAIDTAAVWLNVKTSAETTTARRLQSGSANVSRDMKVELREVLIVGAAQAVRTAVPSETNWRRAATTVGAIAFDSEQASPKIIDEGLGVMAELTALANVSAVGIARTTSTALIGAVGSLFEAQVASTDIESASTRRRQRRLQSYSSCTSNGWPTAVGGCVCNTGFFGADCAHNSTSFQQLLQQAAGRGNVATQAVKSTLAAVVKGTVAGEDPFNETVPGINVVCIRSAGSGNEHTDGRNLQLGEGSSYVLPKELWASASYSNPLDIEIISWQTSPQFFEQSCDGNSSCELVTPYQMIQVFEQVDGARRRMASAVASNISVTMTVTADASDVSDPFALVEGQWKLIDSTDWQAAGLSQSAAVTEITIQVPVEAEAIEAEVGAFIVFGAIDAFHPSELFPESIEALVSRMDEMGFALCTIFALACCGGYVGIIGRALDKRERNPLRRERQRALASQVRSHGMSGSKSEFISYALLTGHKYMKIFHVSPDDNYSRPRRSTVLLLSIVLSLNANAFFYKSKNPDDGEYEFATKVAVGIFSVVLTLIPVKIIELLFKLGHGKEKNHRNLHDDIIKLMKEASNAGVPKARLHGALGAANRFTALEALRDEALELSKPAKCRPLKCCRKFPLWGKCPAVCCGKPIETDDDKLQTALDADPHDYGLLPTSRVLVVLPWILSFAVIVFGVVMCFFWAYALAKNDHASSWATSCVFSVFAAILSGVPKVLVMRLISLIRKKEKFGTVWTKKELRLLGDAVRAQVVLAKAANPEMKLVMLPLKKMSRCAAVVGENPVPVTEKEATVVFDSAAAATPVLTRPLTAGEATTTQWLARPMLVLPPDAWMACARAVGRATFTVCATVVLDALPAATFVKGFEDRFKNDVAHLLGGIDRRQVAILNYAVNTTAGGHVHFDEEKDGAAASAAAKWKWAGNKVKMANTFHHEAENVAERDHRSIEHLSPRIEDLAERSSTLTSPRPSKSASRLQEGRAVVVFIVRPTSTGNTLPTSVLQDGLSAGAVLKHCEMTLTDSVSDITFVQSRGLREWNARAAAHCEARWLNAQLDLDYDLRGQKLALLGVRRTADRKVAAVPEVPDSLMKAVAMDTQGCVITGKLVASGSGNATSLNGLLAAHAGDVPEKLLAGAQMLGNEWGSGMAELLVGPTRLVWFGAADAPPLPLPSRASNHEDAGDEVWRQGVESMNLNRKLNEAGDKDDSGNASKAMEGMRAMQRQVTPPRDHPRG
jgi:hypothetical protein